ncbi:CoA transferase, partial [Streptomyces sp. NPDC004270]
TVPVWGSGDYTTAIAIYAAITTALYRRERTGQGANVGTSLLATGIWATGTLVAGALAEGDRGHGFDRCGHTGGRDSVIPSRAGSAQGGVIESDFAVKSALHPGAAHAYPPPAGKRLRTRSRRR